MDPGRRMRRRGLKAPEQVRGSNIVGSCSHILGMVLSEITNPEFISIRMSRVSFVEGELGYNFQCSAGHVRVWPNLGVGVQFEKGGFHTLGKPTLGHPAVPWVSHEPCAWPRGPLGKQES